MNPQELPLKDIHLPAPIGWWPLAPGWWLVVLVILAIVGWIAWRWWQWHKSMQGLQAALHELETLQRQYAQQGNVLVRELSVLLRRIAISLYGRQQVSGYTGSRWLEFLDQKAGKNLFKGKFDHLLTELPYQPEHAVNAEALVKAVRAWIHLQRGHFHV